MNEICNKCGLPEQLCVCETIAKESQRIKVYTVTKKFQKVSTIIEGLDKREIDVKDVARKLKSEFACGGTVKEGRIELQGDHRPKIKNSLVNLGFQLATIDVR
ncbi:stress response translation initiation inhibitor YciH [Candidatus Woesearchaeota archaeon]|nr:stress response translation initiation inhibitor YciH [Candidatus Woesearchaeota archaeon]|tara:strand:+ start:14024 stop:14332 length:309 start_codon:yes stop_codon:yes gene_type:complete